VYTKVSAEYTASIFSPEEGDSMFRRNFGLHLKSTRRHRPEQHKQYLHRRENLKSYMFKIPAIIFAHSV
jgi:hypothetical protein